MIQAGGLDIPKDLTILPGPNKPNFPPDESSEGHEREYFSVPDFVFLIEHLATGKKFLFDLGMRKDLENSTPKTIKTILPVFKSTPKSVVDILEQHGSPEQQPSEIKAIIFSHLHFDHFGDFGQTGLRKAELWVGPTSCTLARPGYPIDPEAMLFSSDLPTDGSRKIVEFELSQKSLGEKRWQAFQEAINKGYYQGVELRKPTNGWIALGAFESALDLFEDGSVYLIDTPGHTAGHQMLLVRVKINPAAADDFVLLTGDCYHHPVLLADPWLVARPPFSKFSMHRDPDIAINTIFRARRCAKEDNIWALGAHDFSIKTAISPDTDSVEGLVLLNDWRQAGWKHQ
jgi:glyoxylase-like metal-dependent hydrolase (beta-lactamase superfamily II)